MPSRLKSLELQGYKTFASRTIFEFSGTVTAIVGPNGSGKSNLSDALRWVLGEQSYSLLRAKKTEDLIFSGSEQRPRASMASATIVFDNADGWLPIDYTEVAITRRAYRDGENEYLLNGQRVRLRDVSELLAQSGLAERTYTVIGQGLVDEALALKAEDRRRLFEEAAGIGLHRARREEALRRLDATSRNLERVQDILSELQPRLSSLERQARRAQEYEQVKADLRMALREWYGYHWHRAQKELAEAREIVRARENVLNRVRQEAEALSARLTSHGEVIQGLRSRLAAWHRESAQLHTRWETLSRELAVSEERQRALNEQCVNLKAELSRLEEEQALARQMVESADNEVKQLQSELAEARTQVIAARQALEGRQAERALVERALQTARQELSAYTTQQAQTQALLLERQASMERWEETLQALGETIAHEEHVLKTAESNLAEAARAFQEAEDSRRAVEDRLHQLHQSLEEAERERQETLERMALLNAQAAGLRAQIEVLEGAEKALIGYSSGARLLIEAVRSARLGGVRGALNSFLEIPVELETAIGAALGEFIDALLLEGESGEALDMLQSQSARAALLPLLQMRPDGSWPQFEGIDGVLGMAADLVKCPEELRSVVEVLLRPALVVRDRPSARRVLEALRSEEFNRWSGSLRVVTMQGEVFYAAGPILACPLSDASQEGSAALSRPRQLRELRSQLDRVGHELSALDEKSRQIESVYRQLRGEEDRLLQELAAARAYEETCRASRSQSELAWEQLRRQIQWRNEEQQRLRKDREQAKDDIDRISARLSQFDVEIAQARKKMSELGDRLAELSLEETQAQFAHWNMRAAVAERALMDAENRLRERRSALQTTTHALAVLRTRLDEAQKTLQKVEGEQAIYRQEAGQVGTQLEALRRQIEPTEVQLEEEERQQARLQASEADARQNLSLADHHYAQARIVLARRQEALDSLRRRVEDDFGLVAFDYEAEISGQAPLPLEGMVEQLPAIPELAEDLEETIKRQRAQLRRMGPVNPEAQAEYEQVRERFDFLTEQVADLTHAAADLKKVISELDSLMESEFRKTFEAVAEEFQEIFSRLFGGGVARLLLTDPQDLTSTGIEIEARLPGRRTQGLSLLSGGERSLAATALVFALLKVSPTPFCVLDEVDAMLDETNVGRFCELLRELSQNTQFVVITHNRNTVQAADVIYGVTMGRDSASQVLSLSLDEIDRVVG